ncbi:MAG: L,D-transpeptidase family protein [Phycisphaerales bacterium]
MSTQTPVRPVSATGAARTQPTSPVSPPRLFIPADRRGPSRAMLAGIVVAAGVIVIVGAVVAYRLASSPAGAESATEQPVNDPLTAAPERSADSNTIVPAGLASRAAAERSEPGAQPAVIEMGKEPTSALLPVTPGARPTEPTADQPAGERPGNPTTQDGSLLPAGPTTAPTATPATNAPPPPPPPISESQRLVEQAGRAQSSGALVEARALLNRALLDARSTPDERASIRSRLASINDTLIFSSAIDRQDSSVDVYAVAAGDSLVTIRNKLGLPVDWRLIQRINGVKPTALRVGQKLKVITMPFHAVVSKSAFRLDLYMGDPVMGSSAAPGPDGQDPSWVFVRSFPVGLGEVAPGSAGTPEGTFTVKPRSKLIDPHWVNPRTGERFDAHDPRNPIGEHWIGLEGVDPAGKPIVGYGIHGTIDPDSIGKQKSMGCVRMNADDIALIYEMLIERISSVRIVR